MTDFFRVFQTGAKQNTSSARMFNKYGISIMLFLRDATDYMHCELFISRSVGSTVFLTSSKAIIQKFELYSKQAVN